jgi:catalase
MLSDSTQRSDSNPERDRADDEATSVAVVDAINAAFGRFPHRRAIHAKGIVLYGRFIANPGAAAFSKAPHLSEASVKVTVRFSNFSPDPAVPDTTVGAGPRGLAVRFHLTGEDTDIVAHSFNGFPVSSADGFRRLMLAIHASKESDASPSALEVFFRDHPAARTFLEAPNLPPVSYATLRYFGGNSFRFVNAAGRATVARYQFLPVVGEAFLSQEERGASSANYLQEEIRARVARGPIAFALVLQLAEAGDVIDDASVTWSDTNRRVELGSIFLDRVDENSEAAERELLFDPGALPVGIEPADPMIRARSKLYPESYERRRG